jgi:hypothetical protein
MEGALPSEINGCPLDVIETGVMHPASAFLEPACRLRPGNTINHPQSGTGTIGCLVRERLPLKRSQELYRTLPQSDILILSCNHVIANYNNAQPGEVLLHPGYSSSGPPQPCAKLVRYEPLLIPELGANEIDAAVAKPLVPVNPDRQGRGIPEKLGDANVLDRVFLVGSTSGHTDEVVLDVDGISFGSQFGPLGNVDFVHSIITPKMSAAGDSGAVIVKKDPNIGGSQLVAVGMLYGDDRFTQQPPPNLPQSYFNHLRTVLDTLRVNLVVRTTYPNIIWV